MKIQKSVRNWRSSTAPPPKRSRSRAIAAGTKSSAYS